MNNKLKNSDINLFMSEVNERREERFLRGITDNYNNRLKFSFKTCTDGNLVQVNPFSPYIKNLPAVKKVLEYMNLDQEDLDQEITEWTLLKIYTRGGIAHEAFHILFSDFKVIHQIKNDFLFEEEVHRQTIFKILNIIEDAYIEIAGINFLKGLEFYIEFSNLLAFENLPQLNEIEDKCIEGQIPWLDLFLQWAMTYTIIGKTKGKIRDEKMRKIIEKTKPFFQKGRKEKNSNKRYEYAKKIYDVIRKLIDEVIEKEQKSSFEYIKSNFIPKLEAKAIEKNIELEKDFDSREEDIEEDINDKKAIKEQDFDSREEDVNDKKAIKEQDFDSREEDVNDKKAIKEQDFDSREEDIEEGINDKKTIKEQDQKQDNLNKIKKRNEIKELLEKIKSEKKVVEKLEQGEKKKQKKETKKMEEIEEKMKEVKYSEINKRIKIETITNFEKAEKQREKYEEIYLKNKKTIKRFKKNLFTLIKNQEESWETKKQIGSFLDTRRLADPKNRIWKKKEDKKEVADLCIQLMIDGSGSMSHKLMSVIEATIIFYEVAKALNIPISIIEERAIGGHPLVRHKILIDYINYKKNNIKYNILQLDSLDGTREGVSLKWIGTRQNLQPYKDKLLIVLADGMPNHRYDNYRGEVAAKDTKKAAEQLEKIGINLIAVALERSCYENLSRIYNNVVLCDNLNKLPEQMTRILKKFIIK